MITYKQPRWENPRDPLAKRENLMWLGMPPSTRDTIKALYHMMQRDEYDTIPPGYLGSIRTHMRSDYMMDYKTGKPVYRSVNEFETWFLARMGRHYSGLPGVGPWLRIRRAMCIRRQMSE
jgi:hypothetical protein